MPTEIENASPSTSSGVIPRRRSGASTDKRRGRSRSPGAYLRSMVTKERKAPTTAEENPSSSAPSVGGSSKKIRRSRSSTDKRRGRSRSPGAYLRKKGKSLKGFFKTSSEKSSTRRLDASLKSSTSSSKSTPLRDVSPPTPAPVPKQERDKIVFDIEVDGVASSEERKTPSDGTDAEEKKSEETNDLREQGESSNDMKVGGVVPPGGQTTSSSESDAGEEKQSEDGKDIEKTGNGANIVPAQLSQTTVNSEFDAGEEKKYDDMEDVQAMEKTDNDAAILPAKSSGTDLEETVISNTVQIILLLMDPASRRFELLQLEFDAAKAIVEDLLSQIPSSATEKSVQDQKYDGICTIDGEEMTCSEKLRDFVEQNEGINSVVLAMPEGVSAMKCAKMGLAILADSSVAAMVDPSGKMQSLVSKSETTEVEPATSDEPVELKIEEASEEEDVSNVTSEPQVAPTVEKEIADATPEPSSATTSDELFELKNEEASVEEHTADGTSEPPVVTVEKEIADVTPEPSAVTTDVVDETEVGVSKGEELSVGKETMVEDPVLPVPEEAPTEKEVAGATPELPVATTDVADEPEVFEMKTEEPTVDKDAILDDAAKLVIDKTPPENETSDVMSELSAASSHVADELISSMININEPNTDGGLTLENPVEMTMEETSGGNETADVTPEPSVVTTDVGDDLFEKSCAPDAALSWDDVRMLITAILVFFVPIIALCLSRQHSVMSAPFSRGDVITPGVTRTYCGLFEKVPFVKTCQTKLVNFDENGVLSLYHGDEVQWQMKGGKCNGSGKAECIVRILEDGSVLIAGKKARMEGNIAEEISPWPFAEEVVVKKRKL